MSPVIDDPSLGQLLERCRRDHLAWINGDGSPYELPDDGTILGAVGGYSRGGPETGERQRALAARWRRGTGTIEFLDAGIGGDLAWLTFIERGSVELDTDPEGSERRWDLRVTEIFRRSDGVWHRVHRHADPLVDRRSLDEVTDLLA
jgi:ketosteroid isomerase-like protein